MGRYAALFYGFCKMNEVTPASIRLSAMNLLAMREHSMHELITKLSKKFTQIEWIRSEIEKLQKDGLQSDERFAEAYTSMRLRQGKGAQVIRMELKERGVAPAIISSSLSEYDDWNKRAMHVYLKKYGSKPIVDLKEKSRRIRFLMSRGFSSADIQFAMDNASKAEE